MSEDSNWEHFIKLLDAYQKRLSVLKTQEEKFGLNCPIYIQVEIDEIKEKIGRVLRIITPEVSFDELLKKNPRGVTLEHAIISAGLIDIENREEDTKFLPPKEFYAQAKQEVVITATTASHTFHLGIDVTRKILRDGKKLYVLILNPASESLKWMNKREDRPLEVDIEATIRTIRLLEIDQHPGFQIRLMKEMPPFTAVMIDGDISPTGNPRDDQGQIRVQPSYMYGSQHKGVIFQFRKKPHGVFDLFANDIRRQWDFGEKLS